MCKQGVSNLEIEHFYSVFGPLIVNGLLSDICVVSLVCALILFIKVISIYASS